MRVNVNLLWLRCSRVWVVVSIHLVLILYGLFLTIYDIINEQYPLTLHEATYVGVYYFIHFLLIFLLLAGTQKQLSLLYLPWLTVFWIVFAAATYVWLKSVMRGSIAYVIPSISNILILGLGWFSWGTVFKNYRDLRQKSKQFLLVQKD